MAGPNLPDAPDGVLTKQAQTAYRMLLFVVGLLGVGGLSGAFLALALHGDAHAAGMDLGDVERLERKIDKVDDRVRELQASFAAMEQRMRDREPSGK